MNHFKDKRAGNHKQRGNFGGNMHSAICSGCRKKCEVPFKPSPGKTVYCNQCFKKNSSDGNGRGNFDKFKREPKQNRFGERRMYKAVCDGCDEDCEVPFKPTGERPVYCSECFEFGDDKKFESKFEPKKNDQLESELEAINQKLDKVMKILEQLREKKVYTVSKKEMAEQNESDEPKKVKKKAVTKKKVVKKLNNGTYLHI